MLFGCSNNLKDTELSYEIDLEKTEIGYPVNLNINVDNLDEYYSIEEMQWSDSSLWISDSSKVIIKSSRIDTLDESLNINFEITFWDTGKVVIPPYLLTVNFPDSTDVSIFSTDSLHINVESVIDSTIVNIQNDKPIREIRFPYENYRLFLISIIIFLFLFIYYLWKKRDSTSSVNPMKYFNKNPKKDSVKKLNNLKFKDTSSEVFYNKLSIILKKYLENQFYIISFEMTSQELKTFFDDKDLLSLLEKIDSVKFANKEYSDTEKKYDLELAKKIVRKLL
ncbi:MAG: hypothetical protein P8O17_04935 [Candidatus Marinimicrobia bacterium]|jgi:hypothetical protein|nr:hypothetical protein [Candidatus Neomarinimicrobiota bacterium]MDG2188508.1 hypothetical protein [Candidatus Neomarinimicrobiota bacterium]|tara:strand:- start:2374 stop:3213 length:840 start_codon:yes stop_codon:yes gene_type:complete